VFHPARGTVVVTRLLNRPVLERGEDFGEPVGAELKPLLADIHELWISVTWERIVASDSALGVHILNLAVWAETLVLPRRIHTHENVIENAGQTRPRSSWKVRVN
jgi:hypothetical protein